MQKSLISLQNLSIWEGERRRDGRVGGGMGGWEKGWEGKRDQVMSSCEGNEGKYISTL